jgi:AcrR family transcriptional regulator
MGRRFENRQKVLETVAGHLVDHPFEHLSLQGVADACGISLWALRYNFDNVDRLFRAVATHLMEAVLRQADYVPPRLPAVIDAIVHYAEFVANLVRSPEYRNLLYFVIRNGRHHQWLEAAYDKRIAARLCDMLETAILDAGLRHGVGILLREGAARQFHKRIETEFALSTLLPSPTGQLGEPDKILKEIIRTAFESTYAFEWQAATAA